jgi:SAM-dependent methyltransferase
MFSKSAHLYDAIYGTKDYAGEARHVKSLIAESKRSPGNALLDIACGTGGHIPYLRDDFVYEGLELDPHMLAIARERNPGITVYQGDMVNFDLGRQFDVVTCLFSSIAYMKVVPMLERAITAMARHLVPGGVLIVEAFVSPEAWILRHPTAVFVDQPDLKIARMSVSGRRDDIALLDFHYLVATPDGVDCFSERHELGLFSADTYRHVFAAAGVDVTSNANGLIGRPVYVGVYSRA